MTHRQISDCLDYLEEHDTIEAWRYHAEKHGHEAWEVIFNEGGFFDDLKYYSKTTIPRFLTSTLTPDQ